MPRIFIFEDDMILADELVRRLEGWGYEARCATNFSDVLGQLTAYAPQLVIMDVSLPFYNGCHRCRELRKISNVPVIFLSSSADNLSIVTAINMGGDDFIAKPFDMAVLVAKIQAMLRRVYELSGAAAEDHTELELASGAVINTADATLTVGGEKVNLSMNEYRILRLLAENRGHAVSRDAIMERLWQTDEYIDDNTLTVNMTRLRKKLEAAGLSELIETKRKAGYIIK